MFEGWDASGKGGAIKRLVAPLDPRHVRVVQFAAPTYDEKRHHFLGRFWPALPGWGGMAVLDRSWYGRVLVERVEKFATKRAVVARLRRDQRVRGHAAAEGMVLIKFWMHVSDEEQLKRFEARRDDPLKSWKLTDEDWRNRKKRKQYTAAIEDMLERTDTDGGAVAPRRGRLEALGAREGRRDGLRPDRGGAGASACGAPCAPASGRASSCAPAPSRAGAGGAPSGRGGGAAAAR